MKHSYISLLLRILFTTILVISTIAQDDQDDWIDPLDPFSHDPSKVERDYSKYLEQKEVDDKESLAGKLHDDLGEKSVQESLESEDTQENIRHHTPSCWNEKVQIEQLEELLHQKPAPHDVYYSQFIARFGRLVKNVHQSFTEPSRFILDVELKEADIEMLYSFSGHSESMQQSSIQDVHAVLENMVKSIKQVDIPEDESWDWMYWIVVSSWVVTAVCASAIVFNLHWRHVMSLRRLIFSVFAVLFLISIPWTWWHLYQKEIASRMAKAHITPPPECRPQEMNFAHWFLSSMSLDNKCESYYQNVHISPILDVTPSKAMVVTITKLVLEPLEHLGGAVGKMVKSCLMELPAQLWPVALVTLLIIFVMMLVMIFGYKVHMFYLFGLEPSRPAIMQTGEVKALEMLSAEVKTQMAAIECKLDENTRAMNEQFGQPVLAARPSITASEFSSRFQPMLPPSIMGPVNVGPGQVFAGYPPQMPLSGTELPPVPPPAGFRIPAPPYSSVVRPPRSRTMTDEQVEDADVDSSEPAPMHSSKRAGKSKKKKVPTATLR